MPTYDQKKIEKKWQERWAKERAFEVAEDADKKDKKRYVLDMFPYPSSDGLHVGHPEGYTATDIYSRYLRMNGFHVLHPMGWDAFGLPAENFAIKKGVHPAETTAKNITTFKRQIQSLGFSYDWSREINTSSPDYYRWSQWLFLQLYKHGLAYKKKAPVNWCDHCQTVLANEQVVNGACERCKNPVIQKELEQWFFKVTQYAEELLSSLDGLDWPEPIKLAQKNWIGKSEGALIKFQVSSRAKRSAVEGSALKIFTTRPDTLFGATYMVLAPEHPLIEELKNSITNWKAVDAYRKKTQKKSELERVHLDKEKTGVPLEGISAVNPANGEEIPVWIADYVLASYGTGAIMAVPAHDQRDFEFAKQYSLPIRQVVAPTLVLNGESTPKDGKECIKRDEVSAIVYNPQKDEYLVLKWLHLDRCVFAGGGVETGETPQEAIAREIVEETGYTNFSLKQLLPAFYSWGYKVPKDKNCNPFEIFFLAELKDGSQNKLSIEDENLHSLLWIKADEVVKHITLSHHKEMWHFFRQGKEYFLDEGTLINSGNFNGLRSDNAKKKIADFVQGEWTTQYRLRDWLISRQRYWGAPIPIIYCESCGAIPVPSAGLPVLLPTDVDFKPTGESPLSRSTSFHDARCPFCDKPARRESDTMDTFVCSSWYYLRYASPTNTAEPFAKEQIDYWLPVDMYVGGAEHAVLHLLYARFVTKALRDIGFLSFGEPFSRLRNQGMILGEDGEKMSKSRGNVVNPDDIVSKHGADTLRVYEMFMGPFEATKPWSAGSIIGVRRFLERVYKFYSVIPSAVEKSTLANTHHRSLDSFQSLGMTTFQKLLHKTIKKVTDDIVTFNFNTAISALMILLNEMQAKKGTLSAHERDAFLLLLAPFAPHLSEELWEQSGHHELIARCQWPSYDSEKITDEIVKLIIQVNSRVRDTAEIATDASEDEIKKLALSRSAVKKWTEGKTVKKIIVVQNRLINIVTE